MSDKTLPLDHQGVSHGSEVFGRLKAELDGKQQTAVMYTLTERAQFRLDSPETQLLRLLSEDEITLNKAREWLREWICEGIRGPLPLPPTPSAESGDAKDAI